MVVKDLRDVFVYDLMAKLKSDPRHARTAQKAIDDSNTLHRQLAAGKANRADVARSLANVVSTCGFNFGLLLPRIFPRYPRTEPLSLIGRPFMFVMTTLAANSVLTLRAGRQVGKCADGDTEVETEAHGTLTMRQLFDMGADINSSTCR